MPRITVSVQRSASEGESVSRFEEHGVELGGRASVLDAMLALQRGPAPDLAFRFSCRVGMCGSCGVVVNGRERLACSTLVRAIGTRLRIEPLRNLPVVRDVAVDLAPLFVAYRRVAPQFVPRAGLEGFHRFPHDGEEWSNLNHQPQCIDCGCCYSGCTLVTLNRQYLGPMALHRALSLIADPRDGARAARLQVVSGESGAFRCHTLGNCRDACPQKISPTASIRRLKLIAVTEQLKRFFAKWRK